MKRYFAAVTTAFFTSTSALFAASTGNLIAFGDEWTFSNTAFATAGDDAAQMTANLASLFGGTNYLIATNNGIAYDTSFENYLANTLGKSVTNVNTQSGLDTNLATADAVFLAGAVGSSSIAALDNYIANGGNVVVSLGTGNFSTPLNEANAWNPLLNAYGLTAATTWTFTALLSYDVNASPLALDDGVEQLTWGFGNEISLFGSNSTADIITFQSDTKSFEAIGVALGDTAPVPLPAGMLLLPAGLLALGALRRRKA